MHYHAILIVSLRDSFNQPGFYSYKVVASGRTARNMKLKLFAMILLATATGTMFAQDGWRERRDLRRDYADRNADYRDIQRDKAKIAHDRWELREDLREGNYRAAAHERAELRREYRDLNADYADVHRDNRDIRRDRREIYGWRY
jgi:septal ring factor EnvC (AmiA/AmiB activator)